MRVAWDLQAITGPRPTGLGVSVNMLLSALRAHAAEIEVVGLRPNEASEPLLGVPDRLKWEQLRLPARLRKQQRRRPVDLLYSPALGAPLSSPVPVIAHVHDLIPLLYPQQFAGPSGWYWKELLPHTWRHCAALTVSNDSVADDIVRLLRYPRERIHVVPYYPEPEFARLAATLRPTLPLEAAPKFICLGTHEPRKNFQLAIAAMGLLTSNPRYADIELKILGMATPFTATLRAHALEHAPKARITFAEEYLPREEIVRELLTATALLFVSSYEGFGMPPLEALSIGCPVILSDIAAHRCVYDDDSRWGRVAGDLRCKPWYVGVNGGSALADQMRLLLESSTLRQQQGDAGLAYCTTFSGAATAGALVSAFQSVAHTGH